MKIQVNCAGFAGQAITMLFFFDEKTGVLLAQKTIKYREDRAKPDMAVVTNMLLDDLDFQFKDENLSGAIRSYFTRSGQGLLDINKELGRYDPKEKLEMVGVDESGRRYNVHDEIDNGQMAILMAIAFIDSQSSITSIIDATNELLDFYSVTSI